MNCLGNCEIEKPLKVVSVKGCTLAKSKLEKLGVREGMEIKILRVSDAGFRWGRWGKCRGRGNGNRHRPFLVKIENSRVAISPGLARKVFCEEE